MEIYTLGFAQRKAADFFAALKASGVRRLLDIRLNNTSQLAGFTKKDDLAFFLRALCDVEYVHLPQLAPTKDILDAYKKKKGPWEEYEKSFLALLAERKVEESLDQALFLPSAALLCSEPKPDHCHRRLVAEYLAAKWPDVHIQHLQSVPHLQVRVRDTLGDSGKPQEQADPSYLGRSFWDVSRGAAQYCGPRREPWGGAPLAGQEPHRGDISSFGERRLLNMSPLTGLVATEAEPHPKAYALGHNMAPLRDSEEERRHQELKPTSVRPLGP